jgi:mRNA interferase HigB
MAGMFVCLISDSFVPHCSVPFPRLTYTIVCTPTSFSVCGGKLWLSCSVSQIEIHWLPVRVISEKPLREFAKKYSDAATPLEAWRKLVQHGHFQNLTELKQTLTSADMVSVKGRDFYVFNIGGNKYRLITALHFNTQILFVRYVLTHSEYSTERWKQ